MELLIHNADNDFLLKFLFSRAKKYAVFLSTFSVHLALEVLTNTDLDRFVSLHLIHLHFYSLKMLYILLLNKERDLSFSLYLLQVLNFCCPRLLSADIYCVMNESFQNLSYIKYYDCF